MIKMLEFNLSQYLYLGSFNHGTTCRCDLVSRTLRKIIEVPVNRKQCGIPLVMLYYAMGLV